MSAEPRFFLSTPRLQFRTWTPEDLPLARSLWGDPRVTRLIGGPFSDAGVEERLAKEISSRADHGVQYWPAFLRGSVEFVGCCGLRASRPAERVFEMGYQLLPRYWGRGLATEAGEAVVRHAFDTLGAAALVAGHHPENDPSRRVLQKLGFRRVGEELYPPTGRDHPVYRLDAPGRPDAARAP